MALLHDLFSLSGKVAIITGAGGRPDGIGEAYARALAGAGASVVLADRNHAGAQEAARRINADGGTAIAVGVDIADSASATAMVARAVDTHGGVDILVNNAALMLEALISPASTIGLDDWNRIMAVNVTGALLCAQAVAPIMRERGGGAHRQSDFVGRLSGAIGFTGSASLRLPGSRRRWRPNSAAAGSRSTRSRRGLLTAAPG